MAQWFEISEAPLRVDARGNWLHGDEPLRGKIADLFGRNIEVVASGYNVRLGRNVAPLLADDTPFLVRRIELVQQAHALVEVRLHLSDGMQELLDPTTLMQSAEHVLYCRVQRGSYSVACRFAPEHYHQLALHMEEQGGTYVLPLAGKNYPISAYLPGPIERATVT